MQKYSNGVSVILPVYNTGEYLEGCLRTITKQTYEDIEIIIVDDGSTDGSDQLCDELAKLDNRIKVIHKENGGLTSARYAGYLAASREFIYFPDSDDYLELTCLEKMHYIINKDNSDMVICGFNRVESGIISPYVLEFPALIQGREEIRKYLIMSAIGGIRSKGFYDLPTYMWMRLFRTDLIDKYNFFSEREYYTEDTLFDITYLKRCNSVSIINEPLYYYRINRNSLTNQYRSNKWMMYLKKQEFLENFFKDCLDDETKIRLDYSLFNAMFWSLKNISDHFSYPEFRDAAIKICTNDKATRVLHQINCKYMSWKQKSLYVFLKFGLYHFCYYALRGSK